MKDFLAPGATAWLINRDRVRDGEGPTPIVVAAVFAGKSAYEPDYVRPRGTRGMYSERDLFATQEEANQAWHERARAEYAKELTRFNNIAAKLLAFERVTC